MIKFNFFTESSYVNIKTNMIHITQYQLLDDLDLVEQIIRDIEHEVIHLTIHKCINYSKNAHYTLFRCNEEIIISVSMQQINRDFVCNNSICLANCKLCDKLIELTEKS